MKKMTIKERLNQTKNFDKQVNQLKKRLNDYKEQKKFFEVALDFVDGITHCVKTVTQIVNESCRNRVSYIGGD